MFRKILVPVRGDGKGDNVLIHAAALAHRYGAHIQVTHCRARPEDLIPFGVPVPAFIREQLIKQSYELADVEEKGLRDGLMVLAEKLGLSPSEPSAEGPTFSFVEEAGRQVDVIKHHGRLADLIAVAQPDRDRNIGANTLKAALFNTGRPVMMCPPADPPPEALGEKIAIAWNGSTEAARAVALTQGVIEAADEVTILTAGKEEIHGATTDDLLTYLSLRGVEAKVDRFAPDKRIGDSLLEHSALAGCDLLIMGAYGQSHERETIFGGNTQVVVDTATTPVVLVH